MRPLRIARNPPDRHGHAALGAGRAGRGHPVAATGWVPHRAGHVDRRVPHVWPTRDGRRGPRRLLAGALTRPDGRPGHHRLRHPLPRAAGPDDDVRGLLRRAVAAARIGGRARSWRGPDCTRGDPRDAGRRGERRRSTPARLAASDPRFGRWRMGRRRRRDTRRGRATDPRPGHAGRLGGGAHSGPDRSVPARGH